jgi:disulfide oxidoreductase YuzD
MDKGMHYAIVSQKQAVMKPGDVVRGGIQVQDHVLGELPLVVSGYVWRLVCSNGMISQELVSKWSRRSDSSNLDDWFTEAVQSCNESIEHEFDRARDLQEIPVEKHGAEIIRAIFSEYKISPAMREAITDNVVNEGAETLYDVFNAITSAANNADFVENPAMVRTLQSVAGSVALHPQYCPSCFSLMRN